MEMYKRVLEDSLEFPADFDPITCDFLTGLLEKEACERLGWGEDGIEEIKAHPYFNFIHDWDQVGQLGLRPPYIPCIQYDQDISNFDDMFTSLPVKISQSSSSVATEKEDDDPFQGFSFNNVVQQQTITHHNSTNITILPPLIGTSSNSSNSASIVRIRKRHSAALLSMTSCSSPLSSTNAHHYQLCEETNNRVTKKRQTNTHTMSTASQHETEEEAEDQSSIYSTSSLLSFSFAAQDAITTATRVGSEPSISNTSPYQRPQCPLPGQQSRMTGSPSERRMSLRSNASTLNNSVYSYLTLENNMDSVVQQQYFLL